MVKLPTRCEVEVLMKIYEMNEIWGVVKSTDICSEFSEQKARTTILTLLSRLEKKGFIITDRTNKVSTYTPVYSKRELQQMALDDLKKLYFNNSKEEILKFIG